MALNLRAGRFLAACAALVLCAAQPCPAAEITVRAAFRRLPAAFLENAMDRLTDEAKDELLAFGVTRDWAIQREDPDSLDIAPRRDDASPVVFRLFRGDGYTLAAIGTDTGPICVSELWSLTGRGEPLPLDMPPDPHIFDFFRRDARIPPELTINVTFCVRPDGLEARPLFWTPIGKADVAPDNTVIYQWTGARFSKRLEPLKKGAPQPEPALPEPPQPEPALPEPPSAPEAGPPRPDGDG